MKNTGPLYLFGLVAVAVVAVVGSAWATPIQGSIVGVVRDAESGVILPGIAVVASSQEGDIAISTDGTGQFAFREIPIGTYSVRFQRNDVVVERKVVVSLDKLVRVNVSLPSGVATTRVDTIGAPPPMVDVGSSRVGVTLGRELIGRIPLPGDVATLIQKTPGAYADPAGLSLSGGTGADNAYFLEGMHVTALRDGTLGMNLRSMFLEEVEVMGAGFGAEYGHALGGVVNMALKSGGNQWHGNAFSWIEPGALAAKQRFIRSDATVFSGRVENSYQTEFGAEVGGPIIKNKLFLWAGYAPQVGRSDFVRSAAAFTNTDGDTSIDRGPNGEPITVPLSTQKIGQETFTHNYAAKLTYKVSGDHAFSLSVIGIDKDESFFRDANMDVVAGLSREKTGRHDVIGRWQSSFLERHLRLDASLGVHQESYGRRAGNASAESQGDVIWKNSPSLGQFDPGLASACTNTEIDTCPVRGYQSGGYGVLRDVSAYRLAGQVKTTAIFRAAGFHELKTGLDYEFNSYNDKRWVSGVDGARGSVYIYPDGPTVLTLFRLPKGSSIADYDDPLVLGQAGIYQDAIRAKTTAKNLGAFVQESYVPLPELTVNAGVRWEMQRLSDYEGNTVLTIADSFAPRVGGVYDFTKQGRGKVFAHYGQYYESIPMGLTNRAFGGEGALVTVYDAATCPDPSAWRGCSPVTAFPITGERLKVAPNLKGSFNHEVVLGSQYQVLPNTSVGAQLIYRSLGRIIEDTGGSWSTGMGATTLANPGAGDGMPKPERTYKALQLTVHKRFARRWFVSGSYTYARTMGNYVGLYSADSDQLDPNLSTQYDLIELMKNRKGPLPNDRPHVLRADGYWQQSIGRHFVSVGLGFVGRSGAPITPLGRDQILGAKEVFILSRGSAGRTPFVTQLDAHLSYRVLARAPFQIEAFADVFNVLNSRTALTVDAEYTTDTVAPMDKGTPLDKVPVLGADGAPATDTSGAPVYAEKNPNYLRPTSFQAPISGRLGVRILF